MCDWPCYEGKGIMEDWEDKSSINSCKTAEEMFKELGYIRIADEIDGIYKNESRELEIYINMSDQNIVKYNFDDKDVPITFREIQAITQFIKEKEEQKMRELSTVPDFFFCQPLFKEFCRRNGLRPGDHYSATEYMFWAESLSLPERIEIVKKYT